MNGKSRQLALDLPVEPRYGREDFLVSPSNAVAWETFERWPDWPDTMLLLIGPSGAGKSHLGAIWAERARARVLSAATLPQIDLPALAAAGPILLEDADSAIGVETEMFHLINLMRSERLSLAATARTWPDAWGLAYARPPVALAASASR